jgi:hypothetical protein
MTEPDYDLSDKDLAERAAFYAVIGQAISIWADTETTIVRIFARLLEIQEEKAGLILYSLNFSAWPPLVGEMFKRSEKHKRLTKKWNKQIEHFRTLNDLRTRLAHHTSWEATNSKEIALRPSRLDTRPKTKTEPLSASYIHANFTEKVIRIGDVLFALLDQMDGLPPSPKRPASRSDGQHPKDAR